MRVRATPKVDYAFKIVFGVPDHGPLLIALLNAILQLPPGKQIREISLLNPYNDREYEIDKLSIVDIKATDQAGRQFLVEMQLNVTWALPKRLLYYWAKIHQKQMKEGDIMKRCVRPSSSVSSINRSSRPTRAITIAFVCGTTRTLICSAPTWRFTSST